MEGCGNLDNTLEDLHECALVVRNINFPYPLSVVLFERNIAEKGDKSDPYLLGIGKISFHRSVRLAAQFDPPYFEGLSVALLTSILLVRLSFFCFGMLPINQQYFIFLIHF
jgi:hypothetical protein